MSAENESSFFCPIRALDLSAIEAVGFDLDHTLALYDDHAVNLLAAGETGPFLEDVGHPNASFPTENVQNTARGLSMDLRHGNVVKLGADGQVILARRGESWLSPGDIAAIYEGHDPADETTTWHVNSPFDIPTLWFFSTLGPRIRDPKDAAYARRVLGDIRRSLDRSHTHGELKRHIARDMARYVSAPPGVRTGLERWKRAGKRLFVVTNSDPSYAGHVLAACLVMAGRTSSIVLTDAGRAASSAQSTRGLRRARRTYSTTHAQHVEARLGVEPSRILRR
jgi:FMN phosphatase YigB (HAD superfamily)